MISLLWNGFPSDWLSGFCLSLALTSPLPLGMPTHPKQSWLGGREGERNQYIYTHRSWSAFIQAQLKTVGFPSWHLVKRTRDCCFAYCFERPVGKETCFDESIALNLQMWNCAMIYASVLVLKHFVVHSKDHWEQGSSWVSSSLAAVAGFLKKTEPFLKRMTHYGWSSIFWWCFCLIDC